MILQETPAPAAAETAPAAETTEAAPEAPAAEEAKPVSPFHRVSIDVLTSHSG